MHQKQFHDSKRFFHVVGNNPLKQYDKMGNVAPSYDDLLKKLGQLGRVCHKHLSIDESIALWVLFMPTNLRKAHLFRAQNMDAVLVRWISSWNKNLHWKKKNTEVNPPTGFRVVNNMVSV